MDGKVETTLELHELFKGALGRELSVEESEILDSIITSGKDRRITFLEMMKELINKKSVNPIM